MATATEEARRQVIAAREALGEELDEFSSAARSAVDLPAKIRKNPLKTAGLAVGAGFLGVGGPKRVLKAVGSRIRPRTRRPHEGLLPKEIDQVVRKKAGAQAPEIQGALEDDFARYLQRKGDASKTEPSGTTSFWKTYDTILGRFGPIVTKQLAERLFAADPDRTAAREGEGGAAGAGDTAAASKRTGGGLSGLSGLGDSIRKRTSKRG